MAEITMQRVGGEAIMRANGVREDMREALRYVATLLEKFGSDEMKHVGAALRMGADEIVLDDDDLDADYGTDDEE